MKPLREIAQTYFLSRPNLGLAREQLGVFFIACPGSGKSTLRNQLIGESGATYVCNDEVRALLAKDARDNSSVYGIVDTTWRRILKESPNHLIVFDSDASRSFARGDGYLRAMRREGLNTCVVLFDLTVQELVDRISARQRHDQDEILAALPGYIKDRERVLQMLKPDVVISAQTDMDEVVRAIAAHSPARSVTTI